MPVDIIQLLNAGHLLAWY